MGEFCGVPLTAAVTFFWVNREAAVLSNSTLLVPVMMSVFAVGLPMLFSRTDTDDQVASPRQKVVALAPVPLPRFMTGRFPMMAFGLARFSCTKAGGEPAPAEINGAPLNPREAKGAIAVPL